MERGWLLYHASRMERLGLVWEAYSGLLPVLVVFGYELLTTPNGESVPVPLLVFGLVACSIFLSACFVEKLATLDGIGETQGRQVVLNTLRQRYKKISFEDADAAVVIAEKGYSNWKFDKKFTLLFTAQTVSLNLAVHYMGTKWVFLGLPNYLKCRQLLKAVRRQLNATSKAHN